MQFPMGFSHTTHPSHSAKWGTRIDIWVWMGKLGCVVFQNELMQMPCEMCEKVHADTDPAPDDFLGLHQIDPANRSHWMAWDLGAHAFQPVSTYGNTYNTSCLFLDNARCFYDGTALGAARMNKEWLDSGKRQEVIEKELKELYKAWLEDPYGALEQPVEDVFPVRTMREIAEEMKEVIPNLGTDRDEPRG